MTTVVLGWDGLDYRLLCRLGKKYAFGADVRELETLTNDAIGKPHTYELWPTMITGDDPDAHGIHAETYTEGGSWSSSVLDAAATLSRYTVPESVRWRVGRWVRGRGASFEFESLDYYREHGLPTVFDGCRSFPLAIPNARSPYDDALGITMDRGAYLADFLDIGTDGDGRTVHSPRVSAATLSTRLEADVGRKLGAARAAYQQGYDLIWVWLGYVDTVGHVAPTIDDADEWVLDGYNTAALWTHWVQSWLDDDDTLFCVSDHGLRDGEHTPDAMLGAWPAEAVREAAHVRDVAEAVERTVSATDGRRAPHSRLESNDEFDSVRSRLDALGYL